jgi:WD40 repeat protein
MTIDASGKILFTGSGDYTIRVWDVYRGKELRVYDQHQGAIINLLVRNIKIYYIRLSFIL